MNKPIYKFFIFTVFISLTAISLTYVSSYILGKKMNQEAKTYHMISDEIQQLHQTYALCTGLLLTNATPQNIASCSLLKQQLSKKVLDLKEQCPYINFYITYVR
ncbi:MAG: hypothetical protein U9N30_01295 [Campylobacterota bacterium]|nr:hypothetical protein [Campylobacterota bacterium]